MKLLILGGTVFLGRHLVEAALARGHEVTLFNRGRTNPDLFPQVEQLRGDRDGDLAALRGRRWDAAIDTSGYVPRIVRASAALLAGAVERYTFISTISVYADFRSRGRGEDAPLGTLDDPTAEEVTGPAYGPLKALCERAAEEAMPGRVLVIRPGLLVGPHDPTDRFTYWPARVARGGDVLAPGRPDRPVQIIDVRDLAEWNIRMVEAGGTGVYNATGPADVLTMGRLLDTCRAVSGDTRIVWVDEAFLLDRGVTPWTELPLWVPDTEDHAGFASVSVERAKAAGLTFRPLAETVRDTLAWDALRPANADRRAGLRPEREADLLAAWRGRTASDD
jgi:2'-hydroxyisoflavone reductase